MQVNLSTLTDMAARAPVSDPLGDTGVAAWKGFLRAHARLTRALDEELRTTHGFALGDLDVLIQLGEAPRGRLRMCDLAAAVVLSPSGLSRRVDRLERAGLVTRERAESDGRNVEARLTPAGKRLLGRLRTAHRGGVKERFAERFSPDELELLAEFMGRLTDEP
jgi:DNA-binding MarR family transcriptional regulator